MGPMPIHAMSRLPAFFGGAQTQLGVFYPKNHLIAVFPDFQGAVEAKEKLITSGVHDEDILVAEGAEVVQFAEDFTRKKGVAGLLMIELSRAIGTEAAYTDR